MLRTCLGDVHPTITPPLLTPQLGIATLGGSSSRPRGQGVPGRVLLRTVPQFLTTPTPIPRAAPPPCLPSRTDYSPGLDLKILRGRGRAVLSWCRDLGVCTNQELRIFSYIRDLSWALHFGKRCTPIWSSWNWRRGYRRVSKHPWVLTVFTAREKPLVVWASFCFLTGLGMLEG